ncbi:MAG TPA: porphobilinogen synthase [Candidatus Limnocylindrales bacterium]|nr:porphobilinogen synthase [Candidatus Limnocylindrales bacterium]
MTLLVPRPDVARDVATGAATAQQPLPAFGRTRRLRRTPALRALVRETRLHPAMLVAPLFVVPGRDRREPIASMPGQARVSPDVAVGIGRDLAELGVGGVILFGIPDGKDALGAAAADPDGPVPSALRALREADLPLALLADVCLCEYTSHGHCGVLEGQRIANDPSLDRLTEAAVAYAAAGADVVAPSAMLDGQVAAIRSGLDTSGFVDIAILAYAAKHASGLYGPFRDAADSTPAFGDRRSYQMDPANGREALRELALDEAEGADALMVKPAITSLDILARVRARTDLPLAAYQVSGELAMIEAAAEKGWIDRRRVALEQLTAIARAGADVILTYLAADAARWLAEPEANR